MTAEYLITFLYNMLDYTQSPQADKFNKLFNSIDVFYVFKMKLPVFVRVNSP